MSRPIRSRRRVRMAHRWLATDEQVEWPAVLQDGDGDDRVRPRRRRSVRRAGRWGSAWRPRSPDTPTDKPVIERTWARYRRCSPSTSPVMPTAASSTAGRTPRPGRCGRWPNFRPCWMSGSSRCGKTPKGPDRIPTHPTTPDLAPWLPERAGPSAGNACPGGRPSQFTGRHGQPNQRAHGEIPQFHWQTGTRNRTRPCHYS